MPSAVAQESAYFSAAPPCSEATKYRRTSAKFLCLEWRAAHSIDQKIRFMNEMTMDEVWALARPLI